MTDEVFEEIPEESSGDTVEFVEVVEGGETPQDARDAEARYQSEVKFEEFKAEQSDTAAGRIAKHGPGEARAKTASASERNKASAQYQMAASAAAYSQPITFNIGGKNIELTLGEVRQASSDLYNKYSKQVRELKAQGASQAKIKAAQDKADFHQRSMMLADLVAQGKIPPEVLKQHVESKEEYSSEMSSTAINNREQERVDLAQAKLDAGELKIELLDDAGPDAVETSDDLLAQLDLPTGEGVEGLSMPEDTLVSDNLLAQLDVPDDNLSVAELYVPEETKEDADVTEKISQVASVNLTPPGLV